MYHLCAFKNLQNHLNQSIHIVKQNYVNKIAQRLRNPNTKKHCWIKRKFPAFLLYFLMINMLLTFEKSEIFNSLFADQCSPISNGSVLPYELPLRTDSTLSSCHFTYDNILRITNNLDSNKAHGHDKISIRMLKICGDSICRPINIIFNTYLGTGKFPLEWKKNQYCSDSQKRW